MKMLLRPSLGLVIVLQLTNCRGGEGNTADNSSGLNSVAFQVPLSIDQAESLKGGEIKLTMWHSADGIKPTTDNVQRNSSGYLCDKVVSEQPISPVAVEGGASASVQFVTFRCGSNGGLATAESGSLGREINQGAVTYNGAELLLIRGGGGREIVFSGNDPRPSTFKVEGNVDLAIELSCTEVGRSLGLCTAGEALSAIGFAGNSEIAEAKINVIVSFKPEDPSGVDMKKSVNNCLDSIVDSELGFRQHCDAHVIGESICDNLIRKAKQARHSLDIAETFAECKASKIFE